MAVNKMEKKKGIVVIRVVNDIVVIVAIILWLFAIIVFLVYSFAFLSL